jgi:hypothetical protein
MLPEQNSEIDLLPPLKMLKDLVLSKLLSTSFTIPLSLPCIHLSKKKEKVPNRFYFSFPDTYITTTATYYHLLLLLIIIKRYTYIDFIFLYLLLYTYAINC